MGMQGMEPSARGVEPQPEGGLWEGWRCGSGSRIRLRNLKPPPTPLDGLPFIERPLLGLLWVWMGLEGFM